MPECFPAQLNTGQGGESVCLLEVNVLNSALSHCLLDFFLSDVDFYSS